MNREDFIFPETHNYHRDINNAGREKSIGGTPPLSGAEQRPEMSNTTTQSGSTSYSSTVVYILVAMVCVLIVIVIYLLWGSGKGSNGPIQGGNTPMNRHPQQQSPAQKNRPKPKDMPKVEITPEDQEQGGEDIRTKQWLEARRRQAPVITNNKESNGVSVRSSEPEGQEYESNDSAYVEEE